MDRTKDILSIHGKHPDQHTGHNTDSTLNAARVIYGMTGVTLVIYFVCPFKKVGHIVMLMSVSRLVSPSVCQ